MTIQVWTSALVAARTAWEDQAEALDGPYRNLAQATPSLLGSRVGPAADAFLATWEQRVKQLGRDASGHPQRDEYRREGHQRTIPLADAAPQRHDSHEQRDQHHRQQLPLKPRGEQPSADPSARRGEPRQQ